MVSGGDGRRAPVSLSIGLALSIGALGVAGPASGGVTSSTEMHDYRVYGTTTNGLVSYMLSHPFPGDEGPALANIRQRYSLAMTTKDQGGVCTASNVNVNVHFVMTLPRGMNVSGMSGSTRAAWYNFVAFARHHEETRRSIFLQCGQAFVAKAMQMQSKYGCFALQANIRSAFEAAKQACDRRQLAYGRADDPRLRYLTLFAGVRGAHHKAGK